MIADKLRNQVTRFAAEIQDVLNQTICSYVHVTSQSWELPGGARTFVVGHQVTDLAPQRMPLRIGATKPRLWLDVSFQMILDEEREWLTVRKSFFGLFESGEAKDSVFHYDYERNKADNYPDAHLQVSGQDETLLRLLPGKSQDKLHFPVGGRRFRPCLEDMIEFLVREGLAKGRDGYKDVLAVHRKKFQDNQLRAAMRRNPDLVLEYARKIAEEAAV